MKKPKNEPISKRDRFLIYRLTYINLCAIQDRFGGGHKIGLCNQISIAQNELNVIGSGQKQYIFRPADAYTSKLRKIHFPEFELFKPDGKGDNEFWYELIPEISLRDQSIVNPIEVRMIAVLLMSEIARNSEA